MPHEVRGYSPEDELPEQEKREQLKLIDEALNELIKVSQAISDLNTSNRDFMKSMTLLLNFQIAYAREEINQAVDELPEAEAIEDYNNALASLEHFIIKQRHEE